MTTFKNLVLFPSVVSCYHKAFDPKPVLKWAKHFLNTSPTNRTISNEKGFQYNLDLSKTDLTAVLAPVFNVVQNFFENEFQLKEGVHVTAGNAWLNINPPGCFNWDHTHPGSFYSGVAYLQIPKNSGEIRFNNPGFSPGPYAKETTKDRWNLHGSYWLQPEAGDIFLFPSCLNHRVHPNNSRRERISIAFNIGANFG